MRWPIVVFASLISLSVSGNDIGVQSNNGTRIRAILLEGDGKLELARVCGWYVVYMCSRIAREAENWSYQREAINSHTIHTNPAQYPNFTPGWVCAVDGPMDRNSAVAKASLAKEYGTAPTAYAKNAC